MDFEHVVNLVNRVIVAQTGRPLKDVERIVLQGAWENQTYAHIAASAVGYTEDYLKKDVGPKLWRLLSQAIDQNGTKVTKKNIQTVLSLWAGQQLLEVDQPVSAAAGAGGLAMTAAANGQADQAMPPSSTHSRPDLRLDTSEFCGREAELADLVQWIQQDEGRLLMLWGFYGVGKTALAMKVVEQVEGDFAAVYSLSLQPDLAFEDFLTHLMGWLGADADALTGDLEHQIHWVMHCLHQQRYLLVIDDGEVLYQAGHLAGLYRPEREGYRHFLHQVASLRHQSCLVWISQEKPGDLAHLQGQRVRAHRVQGLSPEDTQTFLLARGDFIANSQDWQVLVKRFGSSPFLLKSIADTVLDVYRGNLPQFLAVRTALPTAIRDSVEQAIARLSPEEEDLLFWLAIAYGPVALEDLQQAMLDPPSTLTVQSLLARSLCQVETTSTPAVTVLDLLPGVRDVAIECLADRLEAALRQGQVEVLQRFPLRQVTGQEHVQQQQQQRLIYPLTQRLREQFDTEAEMADHLRQLHQTLRDRYLDQPGYGVGNLIHLCQQMEISLNGSDFSQMPIWEADLQQISLQGANFSQARFANTVFATALGRNPVVAFSADGYSLAIGDQEGRLMLWEIRRGRLARVLEDRLSHSLYALAFSPQGDLLAAGTEEGNLQLWPLASTFGADTLYGHTAPVKSLAFSTDGHYLASGDETGAVRLWEVASGLCVQTWEDHTSAVSQLQFSPDDRLLISCGEDQQVSIRAVDSGEQQGQFQARAATWLKTAGFLPHWPEDGESGAFAYGAGYEDHCLVIWDIQAGRPRWLLPTDVETLPTMQLSPNGRYLACSRQDCTVAVWDVLNHRCCYTLSDFVSPVWTLQFSPDSRFLVTGSDYTVKVWEVGSGHCLRSLWSQRFPVQCLTFTGDSSRLITGHEDHKVRLWQVNATGAFARCPHSLTAHAGGIRTVAASPDGRWLASSSDDRTIRLWSSETSTCQRLLTDTMSPATLLAFSQDGQWLISGGEDAILRLWHVDQPGCQARLTGHGGPISALAISRDNQYLASASRDRTVRLWHLETGQCLAEFTNHRRHIHTLAFLPDGRHLITASQDGSLGQWQIEDGTCLGTWQHPQGHWLHGVAVTAEGEITAITSDTLTVELWSVQAGQPIHILNGHTHPIWRVCLSLDQRYLATASQDEEIRIWRLDLGSCEQILRPDRPYEGVNIRDAEGLTEPEKMMLRSLGAIVSY